MPGMILSQPNQTCDLPHTYIHTRKGKKTDQKSDRLRRELCKNMKTLLKDSREEHKIDEGLPHGSGKCRSKPNH